jgi:hypothetical protein
MSDPSLIPVPEGGPEPEPSLPAYTLFDSQSVTIATLLGAPIAGTILMAVNYRRLGKEVNAAVAFLAGLAVTILAIVSGNLIPTDALYALPVILLVAMRGIAQALQGSAVQQHVSQGGKLGSRWIAFGLGIGSLAVILGGLFVLLVIQQVAMPSSPKVTIGTKDAVYYYGGATKEEAQRLGDKLKSMGYFGDRGVTVVLSKNRGNTVVSFAVKDGTWDEPNMVSAFEGIGSQIAPSVGGFPIQVRLTNTKLEAKKQMTVGKAIIGSKDEIYYFGTATEEDAKALGRVLKSTGYLSDKGVTVLLAKGEGTEISFVVREGIWDKPETVAAFETLARKAASAVGGLPVKLRFVNNMLETKKEVTVQ